MVAQGIVAFQQRLYDKEKAEEVVDLHQVVHKMMRIAVMMTKLVQFLINRKKERRRKRKKGEILEALCKTS